MLARKARYSLSIAHGELEYFDTYPASSKLSLQMPLLKQAADDAATEEQTNTLFLSRP